MLPYGGTHKATELFRPVIRTAKTLSEVCDVMPDMDGVDFMESLDGAGLQRYLTQHPSREINVHVLLEYLDARVTSVRGNRRGRMPLGLQAEQDKLQGMARKLRAAETLAGKLLGELTAADAHCHSDDGSQSCVQSNKRKRSSNESRASSSASPATRSRRLTCKQSDPETSRSPMVSKRVTYKYPLSQDFRTRRVAVDLGAQKCSRLLLKVLAPHTVDLDIENCCFTITKQLLQKLELVSPMPVDLFAVVQQCADSRAHVCDEILKVPVAEGKAILNAVFNGGSIPANMTQSDFLQKLHQAGRFMRWLSCSIAPAVWDLCKDDPARHFPEASTFTFVWNAVEDRILSAWIKFVQQHRPHHLSLHYDGLRVCGDLPADMVKFCNDCAVWIESCAGFKVVIRPKVHMYFTECVQATSTHQDHISDVHAVYLKDGNCIPFGLRCLLGHRDSVLETLSDESSEDNVRAASRCHRSYSSVAKTFGVSLQPEHGFAARECGMYLIHSEPHGRPHATAVQVAEDKQTCFVFTQTQKLTTSVAALHRAAIEAVDHKLMVTFKVVNGADDNQPGCDSTAMRLLDLLAGGDDDDMPACRVNHESHDEPLGDVDVDSDADAADTEENEAIVHVGDELLDLLRQEVSRAIKSPKLVSGGSRSRCPLCPFRSFTKGRWSAWGKHIHDHHDERHQFCASGTKQIKVILCLFDHDRLTGVKGSNYLVRSAEIMRRSVNPELPANCNGIDRHIRLTCSI